MLSLLGACAAVGPDYQAPTADVAATALPSASGVALRADATAQFWWREVKDTRLTQLVESALAANYDIAIAAANLEAARAQLRETSLNRLPDITGSASTERSREARVPGVPRETQSPSTVSANLSWELDLFGRLRRQTEARRANADAAAALLADAQRLIAADVALAYADLREAQVRRAVAQRNRQNQRRTVEITQTQFDAGSTDRLNLLRAQSQLQTTEASLPTYAASERGALNRLTTLTARAPGALDATLKSGTGFPSLPGVITAGNVPALLRARPDIRAAERDLARATAEIGVSTADLFPTLSVTGRLGRSGADPAGLGRSGSSFFGVGPSVTVALFDRNEIHARIAQSRAAADGALATYQSRVVEALSEADTALSDYAQQGRRTVLLGRAVASAREASALARVQFEVGTEPLQTLLDTENTQLVAEDAQAAAQAERLRALIRVYRAFAIGPVATAPAG
ncbi:efflux transporter outer membrane subunit [Sulfitobacter albidus]|uniref:Efflux transporter outer membrane subunit n=1 Tax=Sulfitobacter albidus TaxID=2829501 RepID=A0A975PL02_9RHOB|nr:efflux transporter outer membrane subunit [Sulfitobacter albidus]QUJ75257.1 efflux transporter outer membrane subunit [Sulfitobacter albidus]